MTCQRKPPEMQSECPGLRPPVAKNALGVRDDGKGAAAAGFGGEGQNVNSKVSCQGGLGCLKIGARRERLELRPHVPSKKLRGGTSSVSKTAEHRRAMPADNAASQCRDSRQYVLALGRIHQVAERPLKFQQLRGSGRPHSRCPLKLPSFGEFASRRFAGSRLPRCFNLSGQ